MLPGLACTAQILQGSTLEVVMIDCGNVLNQPLLKNMLAAFAALSRMQRAENILLLRVSRYLRINVSRGSDLFRLMI